MKDALTTEILAQEAERGSYEAAAGRAIRLIETFTNGKGTIRLADGSHVDVEIAYRTARNVQRLMREIRESSATVQLVQREEWKTFRVGDVVSRDGSDRQRILKINEAGDLIEVECIREPATGEGHPPWCRLGEVESNVAWRYHYPEEIIDGHP